MPERAQRLRCVPAPSCGLSPLPLSHPGEGFFQRSVRHGRACPGHPRLATLLTLAPRYASMMPMSRVFAKRPMNFSLNAELVDNVNAYGVNGSAVAEDALRARIVAEEAQAWLEENREAIAAQNAWTAKRGVFADEFRGW